MLHGADDEELATLRGRLGAPEAVGEAAFSFGIEEEYFLVDANSGKAAAITPEELFRQAFAASDGRTCREFLQAQAEAVTVPCVTSRRARAELCFVRAVLRAVAARHGLAILACGTHPTALWRRSAQSDKPRYDTIMGELQMIGHRNMFCGLHVHVELPDPARRVEVMGRVMPYIPLFLALSTSSPFWQGQPAGLSSYRAAAYDELPRTGIPDLFRSDAEYRAYVAALVQAGAIKDASYIWWVIRPSARYPTLELRAPDCCTRVDDAIAIAALYRVLLRHLYTHRGRRPGALTRAIAIENRWRAQRYGIHTTFVTESGAIPLGDFLDGVIAMTAEDADMLGCAGEIARCRAIVAEGTSADAQLSIFQARAAEAGAEAALAAVIDWIGRSTVEAA